ncbi:MAG: tetratricopeptide repeat protein [Candidatus Krumholzibacteria bacterium]|nr:tetratricopeptide repeat protein [Candidatus Krumholzibacteria bacterium]
MNKPHTADTCRTVRAPLGGVLIVLLLLVMAVGHSCGGKSVLDKAIKEYEAGRYRETIFIIRHHFRRGGERHPDLLFIAGKAYLRLGSEAEAEDAFAECFSKDTTKADMISGYFKEEAKKSIESGLALKGKRFMKQAILYDREFSSDFGFYNAQAGDLMLEQKDYANAVRFYERFLDAYPDTSGAADVMMSLGNAYEEMGETEKAIEFYRRFHDRYPKSRLKTTVMWKLENLLYRMAEESYLEGNLAEAENLLANLASSASARLVRERANFLLGEISEQKGDTRVALRYYREVVNLNLGSSGRLLEKAKERIETLEFAKKRQ